MTPEEEFSASQSAVIEAGMRRRNQFYAQRDAQIARAMGDPYNNCASISTAPKIPSQMETRPQCSSQAVSTIAQQYGFRGSSVLDCPLPHVALSDLGRRKLKHLLGLELPRPENNDNRTLASACLWFAIAFMIFHRQILHAFL